MLGEDDIALHESLPDALQAVDTTDVTSEQISDEGLQLDMDERKKGHAATAEHRDTQFHDGRDLER